MMLYLIQGALAVLVFTILLWPLGQKRTLALLLIGILLAASFGLYHIFGEPDIVPRLEQRQERLAIIKERILRDSETLRLDAKNTEAWINLGASFMETSQYAASANAFKQAVLLTGGAPDVIMAYAKAMIASDDGKVSDASKKSLEMVLLQKPEHQEARYWLIVRRVQDGEGETAMKDMQVLYRSLSDESPLRAMINRQIGRE